MVRVTLTGIVPSSVPANGWIVGYRIKGTTGAYTTPIGSPFSSDPIVFDTTDPAGTLYEGYIKGDCGGGSLSANFNWQTPCNCTGSGFTVNPANDGCGKTEVIPATVTSSNYCLVSSGNAAYGNYGSRIYNPGFTLSTILSAIGTSSPYIYGELNNVPQWSNPAASASIGPMNREACWIDSDCDGNKDGLGAGLDTMTVNDAGTGYTDGSYTNISLQCTGVSQVAKATIVISGGSVASVTVTNMGKRYYPGGTITITSGSVGGTGTGFEATVDTVIYQKTTISASFNNTGAARTIFLGVGADNQFKITVNGTTVIDTLESVSSMQFKVWHIIPINIIPGINYVNLIGTGDGSVNDALAMVVYDNTAAQIAAATNDSQLVILFKSSNIRGSGYDIATCPDGYSLDTSGGTGHYVCTKTDTKPCNTAT